MDCCNMEQECEYESENEYECGYEHEYLYENEHEYRRKSNVYFCCDASANHYPYMYSNQYNQNAKKGLNQCSVPT